MLLFFALAVGLVAAQVPPHEYAFGLLPNIPEQYMIASLQDINSEAFAAQYKSCRVELSSRVSCIVSNLLHRHQPAASSPTCCIVSVAEGFLSFGASDNTSNYLEPFGKGSSVCVGSMSPYNATLGVSPTSPGPYQGMWIPLMVAKEQRAFRVMTDGAAPNSTVVSCNGTPLIVILKSSKIRVPTSRRELHCPKHH